jgi:hypothetical protein
MDSKCLAVSAYFHFIAFQTLINISKTNSLDGTLNSAKSIFLLQEVIYGQIKIIKKMTRKVKLL